MILKAIPDRSRWHKLQVKKKPTGTDQLTLLAGRRKQVNPIDGGSSKSVTVQLRTLRKVSLYLTEISESDSLRTSISSVDPQFLFVVGKPLPELVVTEDEYQQQQEQQQKKFHGQLGAHFFGKTVTYTEVSDTINSRSRTRSDKITKNRCSAHSCTKWTIPICMLRKARTMQATMYYF